ncbi:MAG TPA: hypothetical protein VK698_38370, partial [Kofleriaceae bacterium]|nr:hypothetical protein [Kofleriaceae bacterium]
LARADTGTDEISVEIRQGALPILDGARAALAAGRPRLALLRLAFARTDLGAAVYVRERIAAGQNDAAGFEAEWKRVGGELGADLGRLDPRALDGVEPAALRAVAEAALPHVRLDYEASLEYGRNTMPIYGLFYLGSARAERDLVALCRSLSGPATGTAPALRGLGAELDALEGELLAAYRPPASIDRHAEFIAASSAIKEARELDAAGLRRGALLRYLQAAVRAARVRPPATFDRAALAARLRAHADRLAAAGVDHSVGQLFIEVGLDDLDAATADKPPVAAAAIAGDVVTRYLAALGPPPPPAAPRPPPRVTVTLVRWPFT